MIETHRNHFLFSEYHLARMAPAHPAWQAAETGAIRAAIETAWKRYEPAGGNAAHTACEWVQPVLHALGWSSPLKLSLGTSPIQPPASILRTGDPATDVAAIIVCPWDSPLDQPQASARDRPELGTALAPAFQIHAHMLRAGAPWGILTNGRHWRLYHRDTVYRLEVYYAVDLPALITQDGASGSRTDLQTEGFKYFHMFFRPDAFVGEPAWLDEALTASQTFRRHISRRLKAQAGEALRLLAQGFLDCPTNALSPTPATLESVHDHSLIVLYWLMFTFYAESRDLLPIVQNPDYAERHSLHMLAWRIAGGGHQDDVWSYLRRLWQVLHTGSLWIGPGDGPNQGMPAHDGSLFDLGRYSFLEQHDLGDTNLRQVIDLLARTEDPATGGRIFIDYRDLEIRHLGSIYETLLEYQLRSSASNNQPPAANTHHPLSLVNHKATRKATGSYYTPDHIVQWLVEQTLGPLLDRIHERHIKIQSDGTQRITTSQQALIEDILSLRVLDPAMGSGHFLVEAVDFIARHLVSLGLGRMTDLGDEPELTYWRRRVVQSCVYGVDVNPLAVELAKLSLWPMTAAPGKPLSFLDHHIRCGDSLVGVRLADLNLGARTEQRSAERAAGQLSMLDNETFVRSMQTATGLMEQIQSMGSATLDDVRQAGVIYHDRLRAVTRHYRLLADLWTARHFGLQFSSALWSRLIPDILHDPEMSPHADIIQHARDIADERRFFHWELEFPEVFFPPSPGACPKPCRRGGRGERAGAGFDAIIGNPPYLFGEHIPAEQKPFLRQHYDLATGQYDAYWLFYERSFWLLKDGGRHGFIIPDAMLARDEAEVLRRKLLQDYRIAAIAPVGQAFDAPAVGAALVVWEKSPPDDHAVDVWQREDDAWRHVRSLSIAALAHTPRRRLLVELDPVALARVTHLQTVGRPLTQCVAVSRGEETGRRRLRPIETQEASDVPILIGADISPLSPPTPSHCIAQREIAKDRSNYRPGKIVMVKTGRDIVCTLDRAGHVTLQSIYNLIPHPTCRLDIAYLAAILSSSLLSWYLRATVTGYKHLFPQINQSNVEELPVRPIEFTTPAESRKVLLARGKELCEISLSEPCTEPDRREAQRVIDFVANQLRKQPERADVVHDLLAWLANQALELNGWRQSLMETLDPFQYFDRDIPFIAVRDAFAGVIEHSVSSTALQSVHHDIDDLRLTTAGNGWQLHVQLKKRDPDSGWTAWQYHTAGNRIVREWVPACRLTLGCDQARYYQFALEVLDQFSHARSLPGGYRRTTWEKLLAIQVPAFDPEIDITPLAEQRSKLAGIDDCIARTAALINQIVDQLYGLSGSGLAALQG